MEDIVDRILVVDDNLDYRRFVAIVLKNAGFAVVTVGSGKAGVEKACSQNFKAIITDVESGSGNGDELLQYFKTHCPKTPVTILTCADISPSQAKTLGAAKFLRKPVDAAVLLDAVRSL